MRELQSGGPPSQRRPGFVFISHTGEIYPSGFLPVSAGNVRCESLVDVYQNSMLFRVLRDPGQRQGSAAGVNTESFAAVRALGLMP
jgi:MoaA/NifB/PqqE/SkfB family radical SAM enzyme